MVDVGDIMLNSIVGHLLGKPQPADTATIDLNIADLAKVDEVLCHMAAMGSLSASRAHRLHALAEACVSQIRRAMERLFEESHTVTLHGVEPCCGRINAFAEDLTGINQQNAVLSEAFTRSIEL